MLLTKTSAAQWPLQLRMPTLESEGSSPTPYGVVGTTLLKRHKILPHPQQQQPNTKSVQPLEKLTFDTSLPSSPESSSSRTLKHSSQRLGAPSLPLTPPAQSRQISTGLKSLTSANENIPPAAPSVPGTPPNQLSPPTPDVTPPKAAWRTTALRPLVNDRYPSSRADSFKTAKETQTPNHSDEDEFFRFSSVVPSPLPASSLETVHWAPIPNLDKPIGLGLGLESSDHDGSITPTPARQFVSFDGEWGSGTEDISEVEREWDDNLMRNVTVRKRPVLDTFNASRRTREEVHSDSHKAKPSNAIKQLKGVYLQEGTASPRRDSKDEHRMKVQSAFRSISPAVVRDSDFTMPDARRFSTLSGRSQASTIVEAMVVEAPSARPNALRRTKKRSVLRDIGASDHSLREVSCSPDLPHRLVHKNSRIPERRQPSLGSTGTVRTVSTTSSSGRSRKEITEAGGIPVVIIPERCSSSKTKTSSLRSTSSRHTRRSRSVSASSTAPISTSAKKNEPGYYDMNPRRRTRAASDTSGSKSRHKNYEIRTFDIEPIVPVRTSSLSATTSRNNSRTGSLTAESLRAHNESLSPLFPPKSIIPIQKPLNDAPQISERAAVSPGVENIYAGRRKSLDHNGDPLFGNRFSTQNTPFSQISYATSGTGAEVSEALAVPLFPHRNDSLLMVQQQPTNQSASRARKTVAQQNPKHASHLDPVEEKAPPAMRVNDEPVSGPVTPPQPIQPLSMADVDSPLRNPRQAPEPPLPAIKFIPPTPASTEDDRQLGHSIDLQQEALPAPFDEDVKPKRGFSLVRRALSKRRHSEGFLVGWGRKLSLRDRNDAYDESPPGTSRSNVEVDPLYAATDIPADTSRLHPFWRPARFWDDPENDESSEGDNSPHEYGRVLYENGTYPSVDIRPTMPKRKFSLKRTFAILPIKDDDEHLRYVNGNDTDRRTVRRSLSGNMRVVKKTASNTSLQRATSEQVNSRTQRRTQSQRPATSDGSADGNGRFHTIPGIGIRFEYVGFKGLQARLRERNNRRLKSRISPPRGAWHGEDAVLGNGPPKMMHPISRVVRNGDGFVVVTRGVPREKDKGRGLVDGNGGLGEEI